MLLLSGGWPFSVASFIRGNDGIPLSSELADGERSFRALTSTANLLGYTVYPVDVPSSQTLAADAEAAGPARFVRYETKLTLRGKANHVVVAVYDPLSGKIATAESDLVAP